MAKHNDGRAYESPGTGSPYSESGISLKKILYPLAFAGSLAAGYYMLKETGSLDACTLAMENISNAMESVADFSQIPGFIAYSFEEAAGAAYEALPETYFALLGPAAVAVFTGLGTAGIVKDLIFTPSARTINAQDDEQLEKFLQVKVRGKQKSR